MRRALGRPLRSTQQAPSYRATLLAAPVVLAIVLAMGCGGGGSSSDGNNNGSGSTQNVQPLNVDAGPAGNYVNGAFTSVTVCIPGTSNCQTIPGVLVDTGSSGLRVLSSALTLTLPQQKDANNNAIAECNQFQDGFTWGPVQSADVQIAGEQASDIPIQVIGSNNFPVPTACTNTGLASEETLQALGANGILGVGTFRQDCGGACAITGTGNPGLYFRCPSSSCVPTTEGLANQVQNPVWMFSSDNNGVLIQLPSVAAGGGASPFSGSLIFGIGTQSNNSLGNATVFALNSQGEFSTIFSNRTVTGFIDSGSNGLYFLDSASTGLPTCTGSKNASSFYCPATTQHLSATNRGTNGASNQVSFAVSNANTLFLTPGAVAFSDLAGPNPGFFDFGLPFFYGRNVFTAIEGQNTSAGAGPFWAY
jgi:hypothetical protein